MSFSPTLDGAPVFGTCCHVVHTPVPVAIQEDAIFGVSGVTSLFGGGRGRTFEITGLLVDYTEDGVIAAENILLSYADGILRTFVDTQGRVWPNVRFDGQYQPSPEGPRPTDWGWCLAYRCVLRGLS